MSISKKILPFNINNDKLKKNIFLYYLLVFSVFYIISIFFSVFFGFYLIIFVLSVSFLFLYLRKDREDFPDLFLMQWIFVILSILIINTFHFDYFFKDFNIRKEILKKIQGNAYCDKNYKDRIIINDEIVFYDRFKWNSLMRTNICIDGLKNVQILYEVFDDKFHNKKINLIYDMRDSENVYIDYNLQVNYYLYVQKKSSLFLFISMLLYILSSAIILFSLFTLSKE